MHFNDDCLEEHYLITSTQTAFEMKLLWEYTTLMIVNKCSFEGLASSFNLTHNGHLKSDAYGRMFLEPKRLRGATLLDSTTLKIHRSHFTIFFFKILKIETRFSLKSSLFHYNISFLMLSSLCRHFILN